jgi:hypothetical protein
MVADKCGDTAFVPVSKYPGIFGPCLGEAGCKSVNLFGRFLSAIFIEFLQSILTDKCGDIVPI